MLGDKAVDNIDEINRSIKHLQSEVIDLRRIIGLLEKNKKYKNQNGEDEQYKKRELIAWAEVEKALNRDVFGNS